MEASYVLRYSVARTGEAHIIAEILIKPFTIEIVKCLLDEITFKFVFNFPLSDNTISKRIGDMAGDVKETLISSVRKETQIRTSNG